MKKAHILSGIDRIDTIAPLLEGKRVGLMTNPTGIDHSYKSTIDVIAERFNLTALFAVEHGIRGAQQAGQWVENGVDEVTGIPVYSAYGPREYMHFTDEMLDAFDVLIYDMQDIGVRFFTYIFSMGYAMEACNRAGKSMIVLDRINPIGGHIVSGNVQKPGFNSFVGEYELPARYGLTCGELALYEKDYMGLDLDLTIVPLEGWKRSMYLDDTDVPWVLAAPNVPMLDSFMTYLGICLIEGVNVSEGRGSTMSFQICGAPYLNGLALEKAMNAHHLPGLHFRSNSYTPTFHKYQGELCHGVQMHITDREVCDPYAAGIILLDEIRRQAGEQFCFLAPEERKQSLEKNLWHLDRLMGTDEYRTGKLTTEEFLAMCDREAADFAARTRKYHLYD